MIESSHRNNFGLQVRLISVFLQAWRNILSRQSVVMGQEILEAGHVGLFANEVCVRIGNIVGLSLIRWRCHFSVGARNRGKPTQTTAAGQWGEGVQPEHPEPSARDGGADTKKHANDPAGVAASSGQVEDLGLASGPPKRPGLGWGALAAPSPSSLLRGKALAGGEAPDGERLAPQKAGDPEVRRTAGGAKRRKGAGRRRARASSPGNTGIPRQWDGEAAV